MLDSIQLPDFGYKINKEDLMLLKYAEGSKFEIHSHMKVTDNHLGDLIIFPPNQKLIGGDLVIYFPDEIKVIEVSQIKEWTCIFLPLMIPHEVRKIISGVRYSFKYDLYED